ncbi:hypothetical protein [Echinicola shivajiensis]|uniref:hypothetical protein n=1 Tax=Echinicola shivajiensis TaxID=1035916 RepID=UPI001BFCCD91|nr:hypothetical protein [Echinicola shivajiensis]
MKKILMLLAFPLFLWAGKEAHAQQAAGSYLISGALDLVKTDVPGVIRRYQIGAEANYFHWHNISFSGGYEFNYNRPNQVSLGGRFYPLEPAFIRMRGLVGKDSDIAFGAGYTINLSYRLRLEGMVDYYAVSNVAGLRAGLSFLIN